MFGNSSHRQPYGLLRAAVSALLLMSLSGSARANVTSLVEWDAPEPCPGAFDVFGRLAAVLGYEPDTLGKLSRVRGSVVRTRAGFRLVLEAFERDRRSSRVVEAARCEDLADAAAIAIALAMAPETAATLVAATAGVTPESPVLETPPAPLDAVSPALAANGGPHVRGYAAAGGVVEYGALPRAAPGFSVEGGVLIGAVSLGAYGVLLSSEQSRGAPDLDVEFDLLFAGLRGCYALRAASPRLDACGCLEAGRFRGLGLELDRAQQTQDLWLASGAALDAEWGLGGPLGLQLRAEPMLPLIRKQYTVNGIDNVHAPGALSFRLYVGVTFSAD